MSIDYSYVTEKLTNAVGALAMGTGDIHSRLYNAFLLMHTLNQDDFPDNLKEDWCWIINELTKNGPLENSQGEVIQGSVERTLQTIDNNSGREIAQRICELSWKIFYCRLDL